MKKKKIYAVLEDLFWAFFVLSPVLMTAHWLFFGY